MQSKSQGQGELGRYVDTMDRSRLLVPTGQGDTPSTLRCKVFFKGQGFVGYTDAPRNLFTESSEGPMGRVGYVLLVKSAAKA
jgi:hypothetical protein